MIDMLMKQQSFLKLIKGIIWGRNLIVFLTKKSGLYVPNPDITMFLMSNCCCVS